MNKFYGFILLSAMLLSLTTCVDNDKQDGGYICKYFLLRNGEYDSNYLIEVTDSGIMTFSVGPRSEDLYDKILYEDVEMTESLYEYRFLKEVKDKETTRLTHTQLERLKRCISKLKNVKLSNPFVQGSWKDCDYHIVVINENKYAFVDIPSNDFSELLKTLREFTHKEWIDHFGVKMTFDYDERYVHDCQRPDSIKKSCWERIKGWFD